MCNMHVKIGEMVQDSDSIYIGAKPYSAMLYIQHIQISRCTICTVFEILDTGPKGLGGGTEGRSQRDQDRSFHRPSSLRRSVSSSLILPIDVTPLRGVTSVLMS